MVKVILLNPERKIYSIENVKNVMEILNILGLNPDAYIAFIDGKPVPEDETLKDVNEVELLQVFSGG